MAEVYYQIGYAWEKDKKKDAAKKKLKGLTSSSGA